MTNTITVNADGTSTIAVDFTDEDVALQGSTKVVGGQSQAQQYLPTFESDLRRNYSYLFPVPVVNPNPPGGGM